MLVVARVLLIVFAVLGVAALAMGSWFSALCMAVLTASAALALRSMASS